MAYRCRREVSDVTGRLLKSCEDPDSCYFKKSTQRCVKRKEAYDDTPSMRNYVGACQRARDPYGFLLNHCEDEANCKLNRRNGHCYPRVSGRGRGTMISLKLKGAEDGFELYDAYTEMVNSFQYRFASTNELSGTASIFTPAYDTQVIFHGPASTRPYAVAHLRSALEKAREADEIEQFELY